ncbi:phosphoribosyl-AMP cyclohydrolase [Methanobrevibacter sp. 87.7]|uniref:phosphoribosyl-AMP cyclohydrolase n=1 Tax=Methanobrevibacter sp. 87.7 TaxID=387957 RepID=UPI000B504FE2|nr:phosphoribosyl-AMP cyclohydrolase [Methanobrevibacter sp. 87.7]OWT33797.1 phosphoribosyl-AMP cyclohydrolase [Methanobrevibacter sp. 87.7]
MEFNFRDEKNGEKLIIAVAQDYQTNEVLMVAFMNKEALEDTLKTKKAHYYSTSRNQQWMKGESSGNIQNVKEIYVDCDADAIVLKVDQVGAACHEGYKSCFFREVNNSKDLDIDNLTDDDIKVIQERLFDPKEMYK